MTTMPVSIQERIPLAVHAPAGPAPTSAAMTPGDVIRVLKQRVFLILFIWFFVSGIAVAATWWLDKNMSFYRASAYLAVQPPPSGPMQFRDQMLQVDLMDRLVQNEIVRVSADHILSEALKALEVRSTSWFTSGVGANNDVTKLLLELKDDLRVQQVPRTNFIMVSFTSRNPDDAPAIVNTVIDKYLAYLESTGKTDLQRELETYRTQTETAQKALTARRNDKKNMLAQFATPGVTEGMNVGGESYRALAQAVTQYEAEKLTYKAARDNLAGVNPDSLALSPQMKQIVESDPQIFGMNNQLVSLQQEQELRSRRLGPKHREVRQIKDSIDALEKLLADMKLAKEREVLDYQLRSADQAYQNAVQAELQLRDKLIEEERRQADIDRALAEYRAIEEDIKLLEEQYKQLEMFTGQLRMMQAAQGTTGVVRGAPAQKPKEKHFPRWGIMVPAGSALGMMLGIGLALLLELVDTSIKTSRDIPRHVHVPILGTVPDVDDEEVQIEQVELASRTAPRSMVAEAFRTIRTNLLLSSPAERQRTVLVASARPEEGRTTIAINLAMAIAQNGRRVLLVDANFHRPAVQRFFPNTQGQGLSNLLIGQAKLTETAVKTDVPNLDVLPSGPIPPNPTELLAGPYLQKLIAEAQDRYDQIVFDGPPVLLVSDGLVLAGAVDGVVLVCRAKATSRGVAQRAREQLERVNGRLFGAVLNAVQVARGGYYREQIRSYYEYQPEASLTSTAVPVLPKDSDSQA